MCWNGKDFNPFTVRESGRSESDQLNSLTHEWPTRLNPNPTNHTFNYHTTHITNNNTNTRTPPCYDKHMSVLPDMGLIPLPSPHAASPSQPSHLPRFQRPVRYKQGHRTKFERFIALITVDVVSLPMLATTRAARKLMVPLGTTQRCLTFSLLP